MKKVIALLLCLFIILALFLNGCSNNTQQQGSQPSTDITTEEENNLLLNGNILTNILVNSVFTDTALEQPEFQYIQILSRCLVEKEPGFKYYRLSEETYPGGYILSTELCNTVIKQITGNDIDITEYEGTNTKDGKTSVVTETGWGLQRYHCGEFVYSSLSDDKSQVITTFDLMVPDSSSGDPEHKPGGRYNAYFNIVSDSDHGTYLQFVKFEKEQ